MALRYLALLSVEKETVEKIDFGDFNTTIDRFAATKARKIDINFCYHATVPSASKLSSSSVIIMG